jgi:hypothetical protein
MGTEGPVADRTLRMTSSHPYPRECHFLRPRRPSPAGTGPDVRPVEPLSHPGSVANVGTRNLPAYCHIPQDTESRPTPDGATAVQRNNPIPTRPYHRRNPTPQHQSRPPHNPTPHHHSTFTAINSHSHRHPHLIQIISLKIISLNTIARSPCRWWAAPVREVTSGGVDADDGQGVGRVSPGHGRRARRRPPGPGARLLRVAGRDPSGVGRQRRRSARPRGGGDSPGLRGDLRSGRSQTAADRRAAGVDYPTGDGAGDIGT